MLDGELELTFDASRGARPGVAARAEQRAASVRALTMGDSTSSIPADGSSLVSYGHQDRKIACRRRWRLVVSPHSCVGA